MDMPALKLAPSILNCDFARLGDEVEAVARGGADCIHLDVMDGHFVPNLTIGPVVLEAVRRRTSLLADCHLMVMEPEKMFPWFAEAGAGSITFHQEAASDLATSIRQIHSLGCRAGVSIKPGTSIDVLQGVLPELDLVLLMSVNVGFGGQKFMPQSLAKARALRARCDELGLQTDIQMDGGISLNNAAEVLNAGVNVLVVGSAIFKSPDAARATRAFKALMA
jgi:ribulose-phosphate 3-epimerase